MGEQDNIKTGAREVADLVKEGKTNEVRDRLRDDFQNMSTEDFRQFVKQVDAYNADDRAAPGGSKLPDIELKETEMVGTKVIQSVDMTTPGKVWGNAWRNSTELVDCRGGSGMIGHVDGLITGQRAQMNEIIASMDRTSNQQANKPIEQRKGN